MADKQTFSSEVPNYSGGEPLWLEIGERDGQVFIRLSEDIMPEEGQPEPATVVCVLDLEQATEVRDAIGAALSLARAK